jgi:hypothetical protein
MKRPAIALAVLVILSGCAQVNQTKIVFDVQSTLTAIVPTITPVPQPISTLVPTATSTALPTSEPTASIQPTRTRISTYTPYASKTPQPTSTPTNTPIPEASFTPEASTTPDNQPQMVGSVVLNGIQLDVLTVFTNMGSGKYTEPKEGNVYVVCEVTITNLDSDSVPYNPLCFQVKDETNAEYNRSVHAPEPKLHSGSLAIGEVVRGMVAFEVPAASRRFTLSFKPDIFAAALKVPFTLP